MPKIKFDNGVVMTLDREPNSQEIEELGKIAMSQGRPPSIASQGLSYAKEHPYKTLFQPISQTLTGKSIGERTDLLNKAGTALVDQSGIDVQKNLQEQLARGRTLSVPKTPGMGEFFMRQLPAATAQAGITLADVSPFDVATMGLFPKIGKVPIGSTTVRRIVKKVDIGPGFVKGVRELQRLESALQQSGKLSSRGIPVTTAPLDVRSTNTIWGLYNEIVGTKFKKVSDVTQAKPQRVTAMRTISENLNDVKLPNPQTGELETRIPATRLELLDAFRQTKSSVWQKVNQLSSGATEKQAQIDLPRLAQQALQKTKSDIGDVALTTDKTLSTALEETVERIRKSGVISPTKSEAYMKFLNNEIQRLRNSGQAVDFSVKDLYSNLLHGLNEATDQAIESALGTSGYRTFRNQYSSLKSAEKELIGAANSFIKQTSGKEGGITHPIANLWALEEFLKGTGQIATGNVAGGVKSIGQGLLAKTAVRILDHFRLPDRKISGIFQTISKAKTLPVKQTFTPSQRPGIFPFPEGPTTYRRPQQGPPQLPYSTKQLPYLGRTPYKSTGYPGGTPPQKPLITPYQEGGPTIQGQAPYRGTTLPALSPQPQTPRQPVDWEGLRKALKRKTQGQPLRGRHEVSPKQIVELPPRQAPQGNPGIVEGIDNLQKKIDVYIEKGEVPPKNLIDEINNLKAELRRKPIEISGIKTKVLGKTPTAAESTIREYPQKGNYIRFKVDGPEYFVEKTDSKRMYLIDTKGQRQDIPINSPVIINKKELTAAEAVKQGMGVEEWVDLHSLYHGSPAEIEGGKLKFGAGKQLKKGGYMGGHFLTDSLDAARAFQFGGKIYQASGDIKNKVFDVNKNKKMFKDFIGKKYKNQDGEMETFTKNHYDFMFPDGQDADWSTVYADVAEHFAKQQGKIGFKIKEYAGGVDAYTYQIFEDEIPIKTKSQLLSEYEAAKGTRGQNPLRNKSGQAFIGGGQESALRTVADVENLILTKSKQYGSKNNFLASEEYKKIYPQVERIYAENKNNFISKASKALEENNIKIGDKVSTLAQGFSGGEPVSGTVISKGGIPYVKLDSPQMTQGGYKKQVQWHKGWKKAQNPSSGGSLGILGPTMATGVGLAAALKATGARGETGESLDQKYKQQIANAENYGKIEGDWAQLEDIALRDLKRIGKLKQNITLKQVKKDPQLYDKVVKLYWDRLDAFGIPDKDKALWWLMPGRYRQTGGDISRLKNPEHRNIMQNRIKNIRGGK